MATEKLTQEQKAAVEAMLQKLSRTGRHTPLSYRGGKSTGIAMTVQIQVTNTGYLILGDMTKRQESVCRNLNFAVRCVWDETPGLTVKNAPKFTPAGHDLKVSADGRILIKYSFNQEEK